MRILRNKSDIRSILFVFFTILLLTIPFYINIPLFLSFFWILLLAIFCFSCCTINHNHMHHPIFTNNYINSIFNILLTLAKGHTATTIVVPHMMNHHKHNCSQEDWIRPDIAYKKKGRSRLVKYLYKASINMIVERQKSGAPKLSKRQQINILIERCFLFICIIIGVYLNLKVFLLFVLLPWLIAMASLVCINLLQHDGCDHQSEFNHSRNFTGRLGNWICFNNGYHTIHHLKPSLHWSKLPKAHKEFVEDNIDPLLNHSSVFGYLFRNYIFLR